MSTTFNAPITITAKDSIEVIDWADVGPLYEGPRNEDGERPILRPDHQAVVQLVTERGDVWNLNVDFGTDVVRAHDMIDAIRRVGRINPDKWTYDRAVYGSAAYVDDGCEAAWDAHERANDGGW